MLAPSSRGRRQLLVSSARPSGKTEARVIIESDSATRREILQQLTCAAASTMALAAFPKSAFAAYIDPKTSPPSVTSKVYLDVEWINSKSLRETGRIVIGLYGDVIPKVSENFLKLCQNNKYAGTSFYRIISEYSIQGGDVGDASGTGKSGKSSLEGGVAFEPDNFNIQHTQKGLVSMVNSKGGGVDSRFFIQLVDDAGWADDRYAAFGVVLEGIKVVEQLQRLPVQPPKNNPKQPVTIVASGVV